MGNFCTAWKAFWKILGSKEKAEAWRRLEPASGQSPESPRPAEQPRPSANGADALHLLAILQREARLVDFLEEDLSPYDDATVGGIARKVHDDCRKTLGKYIRLTAALDEAEQAEVEVPAGFDARRIKVTGHPAGTPPFRGTLQHHGWVAAKVDFPERNAAQDPMVIAPAEVEV